jgi:hypothetical protein
MPNYYGPRIVTDNLVVCLDAANPKSYPGSGTVWTDLSRNNNSGTLTNGPTFSSTNGGAIGFDGSNDYINGVHNAQVDITGNMTAEAWFYISSNTNDWVRVFGKSDAVNNTNRTYGLWYNIGTSNFLYQRYGGSPINAQATRTVSTNTWYHMVGTSNGTSHVLYLNAQIAASGTAGSTFYSTTTPYTVGFAGFHAPLSGYVSSVRLYNRALSAAEVLQNYNTTKGRFKL